MTRLAWGTTGERFFETGVDRGVLYMEGLAGVPWNGLKNVSESPDGGDPQPYYIDGYKYINVASAEEFRASLSAFSAPEEFAAADGRVGLHNGLFATQQPRKPFGLSYRSLVGNDIQGVDHGYKIHLVYNALAKPSSKENATLSNSPSPTSLSWEISTTPPKISGLKPTAHFVIDSRYTPKRLLLAIEDILYGSEGTQPRLPLVSEIIELFNSPGPVVRRNRVKTPRPTVYSGSGWAASGALGTIAEPGWVGGVLTATTTPYIFTGVSNWDYKAGDKITLLVKYKVTAVAGAAQFICVMPHIRTGNVYHRAGYQVTRPITIGKEEFVEIKWITPVDIAADQLDVAIVGSLENGLGFTAADSGFGMRATEVLIEPGWNGTTFFDGSTPDTSIETYDWEAGVNASPSVMRSWYY